MKDNSAVGAAIVILSLCSLVTTFNLCRLQSQIDNLNKIVKQCKCSEK